MTAGLKPYPAYRESRVPWLGSVPADWGLHRLRNAVDMRVSNVDKLTSDDELPVRLCNYVDVYNHQRITDRIEFMRASATRDEVERFRLQKGDVLITKDSESWDDIGVPALVEYEAADLVCGYHLALLRPRPEVLSGGYLLRALQSRDVAIQLHVRANGVTRYSLSHGAIRTAWMPVPPLVDQAAIARYLDYVDGRVSSYIRAKERLIAVLEEQKLAIVHEAVSGRAGISADEPTAADRESGAAIGRAVPDHWQTMPIKRAFLSMEYGISEPTTASGAVRVLTMANVKNGSVSGPETGGVDAVAASLLLEPGDLLFNRTNSSEHVGKVGLFRGSEMPVTFASYLVRLRVRPEYDPEYMNVALNDINVLSQCRREAILSLHQWNLNPTRYGRLPVSLPPLCEQRDIVERISEATQYIDLCLERCRRELSLVREHGFRLVADVVAGRLDVREAAAQLPDEPEPFDDPDALADGDQADGEGDLDAALEEVEA